MSTIMPEGEDLRRAIKWISGHLKEHPEEQLNTLIKEATFKFDLSPKDSNYLFTFFLKKG